MAKDSTGTTVHSYSRSLARCSAIALLFLYCGTSFPAEATVEQNETTRMSGKMLEASIMAYEDFMSKLRSYSERTSALESHLAHIENYRVTITERESDYQVLFSPIPLDGNYLKGGASEYLIAKDTMTITARRHHK